VRTAVRRGRSGSWSAHLLRSARNLRAAGLALTVAPSGEVTVAWIEQLNGSHRTVRAAYRVPAGRWSTAPTVGLATPFAYAHPRLAVAADGTVALAYNAGVRAAPGMAAAWRRSGHGFGPIGAVPGGQLSEPTLVFDAAGTAFLAGTASCNNESQSHGVVLTAPARTHRFGRPLTITGRPVTEVRFLVTGTGRGLAAWLRAGCSTTELLGGPVGAARVRTSGAAKPVVVSAQQGNGLQLTGGATGVDLTWSNAIFTPSGIGLILAHGTTNAVFEAPHAPTGGWIPIAADAAGDQVLQTATANGRPPLALAARPAGSATTKSSPLRGPAWWTAAGSQTGRTLIAATSITGTLRVATWTP
jgi:hypothetical protein